ncbi:hypothetical protein [Streptomyces sp. NPDC126514]|uniref:hypothetical protein n=1 Tax=Streptomyces sp. NPDC126514 TaxID=3155210 RepID=UPI00332BE01A
MEESSFEIGIERDPADIIDDEDVFGSDVAAIPQPVEQEEPISPAEYQKARADVIRLKLQMQENLLGIITPVQDFQRRSEEMLHATPNSLTKLKEGLGANHPKVHIRVDKMIAAMNKCIKEEMKFTEGVEVELGHFARFRLQEWQLKTSDNLKERCKDLQGNGRKHQLLVNHSLVEIKKYFAPIEKHAVELGLPEMFTSGLKAQVDAFSVRMGVFKEALGTFEKNLGNVIILCGEYEENYVRALRGRRTLAGTANSAAGAALVEACNGLVRTAVHVASGKEFLQLCESYLRALSPFIEKVVEISKATNAITGAADKAVIIHAKLATAVADISSANTVCFNADVAWLGNPELVARYDQVYRKQKKPGLHKEPIQEMVWLGGFHANGLEILHFLRKCHDHLLEARLACVDLLLDASWTVTEACRRLESDHGLDEQNSLGNLSWYVKGLTVTCDELSAELAAFDTALKAYESIDSPPE